MLAFQKILFPIDMSDSCTAAVPFVDNLARKYQAELTLLHVLELPAALTDWYGYMAMIDTNAIRDSRQNELNTYLRDKFTGLKVQRVMEEGDSAHVITTYAQEHGSDLIMMPTHGYGIFRSMLLGSVTAKVLHDAACPVWTGVHMEEKSAVSNKLEQIMCAVDLTDKSIATVQFAANLAGKCHAKLWLVHSVPAPDAGQERYFDSDLTVYLQDEARKTITEMQAKAGVDAQLCLGAGDASHMVSEAALHHGADLLVIGRGHATKTLGRLRTNVYSIIRQSPCPVISV